MSWPAQPTCPGELTLPSGNAALLELACQRAPVHAQPARGFRYVEVGFDQRLMNPLPFERFQRGAAARQRHLSIALGLAESRFDLIGVRGLGEVMASAELDCLHRRGKAG